MENEARRLLMLTLALEEALARENWNEADSIYIQRGRVLDRLQSQETTPAADDMLRTVQAVEDRIISQLKGAKTSVAGSIRKQVQAKNAAAAYRPKAAEPAVLDRAG